MGQPTWGHAQVPSPEPPLVRSRVLEATGGTETSQYPEEKKSTEIPSVVVSESGRAQTRCVLKPAGVAQWGLHGVWESTAVDSQV